MINLNYLGKNDCTVILENLSVFLSLYSLNEKAKNKHVLYVSIAHENGVEPVSR